MVHQFVLVGDFVVGLIRCYMQIAKKPCLEEIHQILRYVKSTLIYGIMFNKGEDCKVV